MENKRVIIATILCFAILVGWQYLAEYMGWIVPHEETQEVQTQAQTETLVTEKTPELEIKRKYTIFCSK